ncbi:MAG: aldehyde ferredoxin oxidoreductase family protein [Anaerolineales bacterium]
MFGRLLKVDLTDRTVTKESIPPEYCCDFIGGGGLAARLFWDLFDPAWHPLDPRSPLLWVTGPLTGSAGPTTGRFTICARSPQTGLWGESNIGGFVGPELRFAGYDVLVVIGRSVEPVYLWINNDEVEIRPASHLWGVVDTYQTQIAIREETDSRAKVACIGRAGENQVPYALILSDHGRVAGRTGMGAVMGSKNLKAVAVRGTGKLPLKSPQLYQNLRVRSNKRLLEQNMTAILHQTGTSGSADFFQYVGDMPQKYWTQATFEGAGKISGAAMAETILTGSSACQGCVIRCGREVTITEGPYATNGATKGPEYETICSFGPQLLVDDLAIITALGGLCDRLGLDSISAGNTIALAYLLYDKGLIDENDTGGLVLRWGDATPCFELLDLIANRNGFGALLAQGSRMLASHYGVEELAVQVNNLDVPMHDPRAFSGMALSYVTSPRGACHNQSDFFMVELGGSLEEIGIPMTDRFANTGKASYVARHQHWRTVCNSLVTCFFSVISPSELAELLEAAAGYGLSLDQLVCAGERAWNLKRMINLHLGWTRAGEKLPHLLVQPLPDGGHEGYVPDTETLLHEYYVASGWDENTGSPTKAKIKELGLEFAERK